MSLELPSSRDFEKNPYSPDEERVAKWFAEYVGIGGGDDPIGALISSHMMIMSERRSGDE